MRFGTGICLEAVSGGRDRSSFGLIDWNEWRGGLAARNTYLACHATGRLGSLTWYGLRFFQLAVGNGRPVSGAPSNTQLTVSSTLLTRQTMIDIRSAGVGFGQVYTFARLAMTIGILTFCDPSLGLGWRGAR